MGDRHAQRRETTNSLLFDLFDSLVRNTHTFLQLMVHDQGYQYRYSEINANWSALNSIIVNSSDTIVNLKATNPKRIQATDYHVHAIAHIKSHAEMCRQHQSSMETSTPPPVGAGSSRSNLNHQRYNDCHNNAVNIVFKICQQLLCCCTQGNILSLACRDEQVRHHLLALCDAFIEYYDLVSTHITTFTRTSAYTNIAQSEQYATVTHFRKLLYLPEQHETSDLSRVLLMVVHSETAELESHDYPNLESNDPSAASRATLHSSAGSDSSARRISFDSIHKEMLEDLFPPLADASDVDAEFLIRESWEFDVDE